MTYAGEGQEDSDLDSAMRLQNALISVATGTPPQTIDRDYRTIRARLSSRADLKEKLPDFVRRCGDAAQFWGWIKYECQKYQERRDVIWAAFRPLIEYLEAQDRTPGVAPITDGLKPSTPKMCMGLGKRLWTEERRTRKAQSLRPGPCLRQFASTSLTMRRSCMQSSES